jgi:preprotein translocase subunit SecE
MRGGPVPSAGGSSRGGDGARLVKASPSKAQAEQMRAAMAPRPGARPVRLMQERLGADFFREALSELRKVHWPTRQQATNLTGLVIGVSLGVGIILGGVDYIFEKVFELILRAS